MKYLFQCFNLFYRKDWNIIKVRLFKLAVQIVEADYLSRLAYKGLKDEVVKRNIIIKKSALRFKSLFSSVAWNPHTCQWLHNLLIEKLPSCFIKVYTDAFQVCISILTLYFLLWFKILLN